MKTFPNRFLLVVFAAILLMAGNAFSAGGAEEAKQFVDDVGKRTLEVINSGEGEQQKQKLRQLFSENVDIDWMGKFVLGQSGRQASAEQKRRYLEVYREYLLTRYTTNFAEYAGSDYSITGVKSEGEGEFTVAMDVKSPKAQQQETKAGYRLRSEGGQFKIIDIIIEGVSLITTQRSEFTSVLQQKGIDGLIAAIEGKTKAESK